MALANVSVLLERWGYKVLVVDWDLEAPGIEQFYDDHWPGTRRARASTPGVIDLIGAVANRESVDWQDSLLHIEAEGSGGMLALLSAGRNDEGYSGRLQSLNFADLFDRYGLGSYIETLRNEWISNFDFVLIDSRTGVTDIGGICTVHLADVLVLFFTANDSSTEGARYIVERARMAQEQLPVERGRLLAVPVPARDESRTEYAEAMKWKSRFAFLFGDLFRDWLPPGVPAERAIEQLRIPYVPYWSFGERLPVLVEGTSDRASLGHAYEVLARILAARLNWYEAMKGESPAPLPGPPRELSLEWVKRHRQAALEGLAESGKTGFMEIWHYTPDSPVSISQPELLTAARLAQVRTSRWPIGVVLDAERVLQTDSDGLVAKVSVDHFLWHSQGNSFDYWTLSKNGDFYTLTSLLEDHSDQDRTRSFLYFDTCIERAAEALLHCAKLYKAMGLGPNTHIEMTTRYGGLRGRTLGVMSPRRSRSAWRNEYKNLDNDAVSGPPITFTLGALDSQMSGLVKRLCEPLFAAFGFAEFEDEDIQQIADDLVRGRVA